MNAIAFDSTTIHDIKQVLAKGLPYKSSHLSEALAACLGARSHAALRAQLAANGCVVARPDPEAGLLRLVGLEEKIDGREALVVLTQSLVYGVEFARYPNGTKAPIEIEDEWLDGIALGCRRLYAARLRNAGRSWRSAIHLARLRPHADTRSTGMSLEAGSLVFDPYDLFRHDPLGAEDAIGDDIAALLRGIEPASGIERPRSLKFLPTSIAFDGAMAAAEALPETSFSEIEAVRLATWLGSRLADHEGMKAMHLTDFARRRLPMLAFYALQGYVAERFKFIIAYDEGMFLDTSTKVPLSIDRVSMAQDTGGTNEQDDGIVYMGHDATTGKQIWLSDEDVRRHIEILAKTGHGHHGMQDDPLREEGDIDASDIAGSREGNFVVVHDGRVIRGESFYARPEDLPTEIRSTPASSRRTSARPGASSGRPTPRSR